MRGDSSSPVKRSDASATPDIVPDFPENKRITENDWYSLADNQIGKDDWTINKGSLRGYWQ